MTLVMPNLLLDQTFHKSVDLRKKSHSKSISREKNTKPMSSGNQDLTETSISYKPLYSKASAVMPPKFD